jgi:nibrin
MIYLTLYLAKSTERVGATRNSPPQQRTETSAAISPETKKEDVSPAKTIASKRMRYSRAVSRFKGFDDFSMDSIPTVPAVPENSIDEEMPDADVEPAATEDQATHDMERLEIGIDARGKKRTRNESSMDNLLPAAATMKRRRVQNRDDVDSRPVAKSIPEVKQPRKQIFKKTAIPKEFDADDELEEADRRNEERIEEDERVEPLTGEEIIEIQEGIQIEEMDVRPSRKGVAQQNGSDASRWDPRWNGRKNFKKFRKHGAGPQPLRGPRSRIRLEEARQKDILLGAVRWAGTGQDNESDNGITYDSDGNDDSQFRRKNKAGKSRDSQEMRRLADLSDSEFSDHDTGDISMDLDTLPIRHRRQTQNQSQPEDISQSTLTSTSRAGPASKKRPVSKISSGRSPPAKRVAVSANASRSSRLVNDDGSGDSEDEFRFKSRRKRG